MINTDKNLPEWLEFLRNEAGFTQQEIADKIGVHKSTYCLYERGGRTPDLEKLKTLADIYQVSLRSMIRLPFINTVIYSSGILKNLQDAIKTTSKWSSNYQDIKIKFDILSSALDKVLTERNDALTFPDIPIDLSENVGKTVKEVRLDFIGEKLISEALTIQKQQIDSMFSR